MEEVLFVWIAPNWTCNRFTTGVSDVPGHYDGPPTKSNALASLSCDPKDAFLPLRRNPFTVSYRNFRRREGKPVH